MDFNALKNVLNNLHRTIKFTVESAKFDKFNKTSVINFLDVTVLLHENGYVETDIFYKETNSHDYLSYNSHHPNQIKYDIPFNLAKSILIFVSDEQKVTLQLKELRKWLLNCGYPESVIDKSFFNAKLQGPANKPANSKNILPLVSTYYPNFDMRNMVKTINQKLKQSPNESIKETFGETQTVLSLNNHPIFVDYFPKKNNGCLKVCLIVIIKTVNYVHYIRLQTTLFGLLGVTKHAKVKTLFNF